MSERTCTHLWFANVGPFLSLNTVSKHLFLDLNQILVAMCWWSSVLCWIVGWWQGGGTNSKMIDRWECINGMRVCSRRGMFKKLSQISMESLLISIDGGFDDEVDGRESQENKRYCGCVHLFWCIYLRLISQLSIVLTLVFVPFTAHKGHLFFTSPRLTRSIYTIIGIMMTWCTWLIFIYCYGESWKFVGRTATTIQADTKRYIYRITSLCEVMGMKFTTSTCILPRLLLAMQPLHLPIRDMSSDAFHGCVPGK